MRERGIEVEKGVEMRSFARAWILAAVVAAFAAAPVTGLAQEQAPKVITVLAVEVAAVDQDAFFQRVKKAQEIWQKLEMPPFRAWQSTLAGPNTGNLVFVTEYDDPGDWAKNSGKLQASAEWQKWIDDLQAWGKTTVTSNSMLVEVTP
jgi:hypothetical protein